MTGRDLIMYILENHLEDEELFKDGKFPGLLTYEEAANKFNVGKATVHTWVNFDHLKSVAVYGTRYIPVTEIPACVKGR